MMLKTTETYSYIITGKKIFDKLCTFININAYLIILYMLEYINIHAICLFSVHLYIRHLNILMLINIGIDVLCEH